ncbi:Vitamin B12 import ATP-binding protein BtuD [subsurface metagenome]
MTDDNIVIEAVNLKKFFPVMKGFLASLIPTEKISAITQSIKNFLRKPFLKETWINLKRNDEPFIIIIQNKLTSGFKCFNHSIATIISKTYRELFTKDGWKSNIVFLKRIFSGGEQLYVHAVDGVSFKIMRGETFGLVGESGCGKSTTGFLLLHLLDKTSGEIYFKGTNTASLSKREIKKLRKDIQIVFQNPYDSLSPRFRVLDIVAEPLRLLKIDRDEAVIEEKVIAEMEAVGLVPARDFLDRYAHELSGGQRQRVGVARAFILNPEFIVADEPVSMLDVSIRVGVLKIMQELIKLHGTAFLFITHDLALARNMCDRIAVMYLGRIVEQGETEQLIKQPLHPYTQALIAAVPKPDPDARRIEELPIKGEVPSGIYIPEGCRFQDRCLYAEGDCFKIDPQLEKVEEDYFVACIRYKNINNME